VTNTVFRTRSIVSRRASGGDFRDGGQGGVRTPTASWFTSDDDVLEAKSRKAFEGLFLISANEQITDLHPHNVATEEAHTRGCDALRRDVSTTERERCPATLPRTTTSSIRRPDGCSRADCAERYSYARRLLIDRLPTRREHDRRNGHHPQDISSAATDAVLPASTLQPR